MITLQSHVGESRGHVHDADASAAQNLCSSQEAAEDFMQDTSVALSLHTVGKPFAEAIVDAVGFCQASQIQQALAGFAVASALPAASHPARVKGESGRPLPSVSLQIFPSRGISFHSTYIPNLVSSARDEMIKLHSLFGVRIFYLPQISVFWL